MIRQGAIYWLENCPPLDGQDTKRRPVIVITPSAILKNPTSILVVVAVSTKRSRGDRRDEVLLPNRTQNRQTTTGLAEPCWAVVRWSLALRDRSRLGDRIGFVSGQSLTQILIAFEEFIAQSGAPRKI